MLGLHVLSLLSNIRVTILLYTALYLQYCLSYVDVWRTTPSFQCLEFSQVRKLPFVRHRRDIACFSYMKDTRNNTSYQPCPTAHLRWTDKLKSGLSISSHPPPAGSLQAMSACRPSCATTLPDVQDKKKMMILPSLSGILWRYVYPTTDRCHISELVTGIRFRLQSHASSEHNSSSSGSIRQPLGELRQDEACTCNQLYLYR